MTILLFACLFWSSMLIDASNGEEFTLNLGDCPRNGYKIVAFNCTGNCKIYEAKAKFWGGNIDVVGRVGWGSETFTRERPICGHKCFCKGISRSWYSETCWIKDDYTFRGRDVHFDLRCKRATYNVNFTVIGNIRNDWIISAPTTTATTTTTTTTTTATITTSRPKDFCIVPFRKLTDPTANRITIATSISSLRDCIRECIIQGNECDGVSYNSELECSLYNDGFPGTINQAGNLRANSVIAYRGADGAVCPDGPLKPANRDVCTDAFYNRPGQDMANSPQAKTFVQCSNLCNDDANCKGLVYNSAGNCYLKTGRPALNRNRLEIGTISVLKPPCP